MAELINCKLQADHVLEDLLSTTIVEGPIILYIVPDPPLNADAGNPIYYTVDKADFQDHTFDNPGLLTEADRYGIESVVLEDTGTPGEPENKIKVTVNLVEGFTIQSNQTIKVDIGGEAFLQSSRKVRVAFCQDFTTQHATYENDDDGGFVPFGSTFEGGDNLFGVTLDLEPGVTHVNNKTYTNVGKPESETGYSSSISSKNISYAPDKVNYYEFTTEVNEWKKIATITVALNQAQVDSLRSQGKIPDDKIHIGFQGISTYEYNQEFKILRPDHDELNFIWNRRHMLAGLGNQQGDYFSVNKLITPDYAGSDIVNFDPAHDLNVDVGYPSSSYHIRTYPGNNVSAYANWTEDDSPMKSVYYWRREWWYKHPTAGVIGLLNDEASPGSYDTDAWVSDAELALVPDNPNSNSVKAPVDDLFSLSLGGIIRFFEPHVPTNEITNINIGFNASEGGVHSNAQLPGWRIPPSGFAQNRTNTITVNGTPGARFTVQLSLVGEVDRSVDAGGRNVVDDDGQGTGNFRNIVTWADLNPDPETNMSQLITIPSSGEYKLDFPDVAGIQELDGYKHYLLSFEADENSKINLNASPIGSDLQGGTSNGNKLNINLYQYPVTKLVLKAIPPADSVWHAHGNSNPNSGSGTIEAFQLWSSNGPDQAMSFEFVVQDDFSTDNKWEFKDDYFASMYNSQQAHNDAYPGQTCTVGGNENAQCSVNNIHTISTTTTNEKLFQWENYPGFNGNEEVVFYNLKARLGNDTLNQAEATSNDFFTVTGTMHVVNFGNQSNSYTINLGKLFKEAGT